MVPVIYRGATLTPHFREFLPEWVARQAWYQGTGVPSLRPVGYYRLEDSAGQVGIETHLLADGSVLYQVPMTYRGAPRDGSAETGLIATTEHSVLGTRWIYDGTTDPVWTAEVLHLVRDEAAAELSAKPGVGVTEALGRRLADAVPTGDTASIELRRVLAPGDLAAEAGLLGIVTGSWQPDGADGPTVRGWLAVVREIAARGS